MADASCLLTATQTLQLWNSGTLVLEVQQVEAAPRGRFALYAQRAAPTRHHLARLGVGERILVEEFHLAVCAGELRLEGRADRRLARVAPAVELVVHAVVGEARHHGVQIVAIERIDEAMSEVQQMCAIHDASPAPHPPPPPRRRSCP